MIRDAAHRAADAATTSTDWAGIAFAAVLWIALLGAVALPIRAAFSRSPEVMWAGALCSLALSLVGMFSIGAFIFLPACLELGAVIALRWRATGLGWAVCLLAAVAIWLLVVPAQIAGLRWLPWLPAFPLAGLLGTLAMRARPPAALGHRI
jgi:hypothetical protein